MAQTKDLEYYLAQARRIAEHREAGAEKEIRKLYKSMLKDLKSFVAEAYEKYADDDFLSYAVLQKAGYDARFLEEVEKRIGIATPKAAKELRELVNETYKIAYDGMVEAVLNQNIVGLDEAFADSIAITPQQIKNVVKNPIMELALEKNHKDAIYDIKQVIAVGLMNGDRYSTMAQRLTETVDKDYNNAIRIARTEAHRVREAGNLDAAVAVDIELQNGTTGMRMCKTWYTKDDGFVRPQYARKRKKGGWVRGINKKAANHMIMHDVTVLADEKFDLKDGNKAMAPGQSGVAGHDINCRCEALYETMTDKEYFKKTGKHFPGYTDSQDIENSGKPDIMEGVLEKPIQSMDVSYAKLLDRLENISKDCPYNPVIGHAKAITKDKIIKILSGGDKTEGSCASVGLAYIGQRQGWNVLDFRGGRSRTFFANSSVLHTLSEADGLKVHRAEGASSLTVGNRLLKKCEPGKEYYLAVGRHASIVRKTEEGVLQYLELQSTHYSGWTDFNANPKYTLKSRFGCSQSSSSSAHFDFMIDLEESDFGTDDFRSLLGYLNTAENEQRKGSSGTIK